MRHVPALRIVEGVYRSIMRTAAIHDHEVMGLLAAGPDDAPLITAACRLPARSSASHAEAEPLAVKQAVTQLLARGLRPGGLWHSHANHAVFHSATDDDTVSRLLPAMAEYAWRRPPAPVQTPGVVGPDQAVLPLPDGQVLCFRLLGREIPDTDAREAASWESITASFAAERPAARATQEPDLLRLEAGGVVMSLGLPAGASVLASKEDPAPVRRSDLFSLVVNRRGDAYAESLVIHDLAGESLARKGPCAIEVVGDPAEGERPEILLEKLCTGPVRPRPGMEAARW